MRTIYYLIFVFVFSLLASGCYEDKGNYDYKEINQIKITGIDESYSKVSFQDVLRIEPTITADDASDELSFLWTVNRKERDLDWVEEDIKSDTIGYEKVLDYPVNLQQGIYEVVLRVTNEKNGHQIFNVAELQVMTKFSDGFYLLKDMGNMTEVDLHLPDGSKMVDMLGKSIEGGVFGKPTSLGMIPLYSYIDTLTGKYATSMVITVCTEEQAYIMNLQDMSAIYRHETMFHGDVPQEKPGYIWNNMFCMGYVSDKGIYSSSQAPMYGMYGSGKFGLSLQVKGEDVVPSKYGVYSESYFFFDELNDRFMLMDFNGGLATYDDRGAGNVEKKFKPNGIKHNLLYYGRNFVANESVGYAIMEDSEVAGKRYLYELKLNASNLSNPIDTVIDIASRDKLNTATLFATNELSARVIYCVEGNNLYMYDVNQNTEEKLTPEGLDSSEEITYIYNYYWTQSDDSDNNFDYLVIGTCKNGHYKVYMYETLGGKTYGKPKRVMEGEGKVVKMRFVSSRMTGESVGSFPGSF